MITFKKKQQKIPILVLLFFKTIWVFLEGFIYNWKCPKNIDKGNPNMNTYCYVKCNIKHIISYINIKYFYFRKLYYFCEGKCQKLCKYALRYTCAWVEYTKHVHLHSYTKHILMMCRVEQFRKFKENYIEVRV